MVIDIQNKLISTYKTLNKKTILPLSIPHSLHSNMPYFQLIKHYENFSIVLRELINHLDLETTQQFFAGENIQCTICLRAICFQRAIKTGAAESPDLDDWPYPIPIIVAIYGTYLDPDPRQSFSATL